MSLIDRLISVVSNESSDKDDSCCDMQIEEIDSNKD